MRRLAALAIVLATAPAAAHIAPSVDDNNRYLKVTPLADRVRLAYTVFFGQVPGAQQRPAIDRDRSGAISEAEAQAFGEKLAAEVAAGLDVAIDGRAQPVAWSVISVGLGAPQVHAGAFSVDLIAYLCLPVARGDHRLTLRDRFRLPRPGETEVKIEDGPGIAIVRARIGPGADASLDFRFAGPGGPLADAGLDLAFTAGPAAPIASDAICQRAGRGAARGGGLPGWLLLGAPLAVLALGGTALYMRARRR